MGVRLHHAENQSKDAVTGSGDRHGADESDGYVPGRILGLFRHGGDGVEADVGEEEDGGGGEDAAGAERGEGGEVVGVSLGEAGDDDEEDDGDVDDGGDVVEAGGAFGGEDGDDADDGDDGAGDGVEPGVVGGEGRGVDAEVVGVVVEQGGEVRGPRASDGRAADDVFEEDVAGGDEGHEVAQLHPQVSERAPCTRVYRLSADRIQWRNKDGLFN